jgi:hypothetical protein
MRSQDEIRNTVVSLGLPEHPYFMRRAARAMDLLDTGKVNFVGDDIFRVHSQFDETIYHVELNHGNPGCTCADHQKNPGVLCKHMIAATIYSKQAQPKALTIYDDTANSYHGRGRWIVTDHVAKIRYQIYRDKYGGLHCPCERGRKGKDCEHKKAIREYIGNNGGGNGSKITNECGSQEALSLQNKLNGQLPKSGNNGNGDAKSPSQHLDISDPFQESEFYDIEQIEGRKNGELAWKLSNGEYCISYRGIMTLAEKHNITFTHGENSNTKQVIARAHLNGNERVSGKLPIPSYETAVELAKRNAARQLLPLPEIKAVEKKAQLESEFDWQKAYAKCVELVGTKAILDCIIYDLVNWGKLRQDNPSHYNRTEWLLIHEYCQKEASIERNPKSTNNWSYNSAVFIDRCKEAIAKVRDEKKVEALEQPLEANNGKRKLQMDKKLRTWLVETDGTKTEISCREICEQFESKANSSIVTRLRAGIDDGADISTVELND